MSLTLGQIQVETFARSLKQKVSVLSNFTQVSLLKKKKEILLLASANLPRRARSRIISFIDWPGNIN